MWREPLAEHRFSSDRFAGTDHVFGMSILAVHGIEFDWWFEVNVRMERVRISPSRTLRPNMTSLAASQSLKGSS
jgi:hypothetical protein